MEMVVGDLFAGGGEMEDLMRSHDWSQTLLGSVSEWAQSLKTALSIILTSRYPMFIWWGSEYANLYNDAYRPILGASKHPQFLGQSAKDCWADVWDVVGPLADRVLTTGQPTWSEDLLLPIDRNGYLEETYFTFSYSPLRDESGKVGGVFCAMTETTGRIIGERRLRTLRELAAKTAEAKTVWEACHIAAKALSINPYDIPFALLYRVEPDGKQALLAGTTGIEAGTVASPEQVDLVQENEPNGNGKAFCWNLAKVNRTGKAELVTDLPTEFSVLLKGARSDRPTEALVIPITQSGKAQLAGLLVVGISPLRKFDDDYQGFFDLIASNVATAIANADAYESTNLATFTCELANIFRSAIERVGEVEDGRAMENSPDRPIAPLPPRVLLVGDNADIRDYLQRSLSRDYEVEAVSDGLAALDAIQRHLPDLVLTDVMMPRLDGLGLLRSLRNDPATQNIPIILLRARTEEESRVEGLQPGADDYLVKPICARELLARVKKNLELARLRQETVRYQEQLRIETQAAQTQVKNILESITDAFVAFDREWHYIYVNDYAARLLRKKREELLGKHVWTEVFPELVGTQSYCEFHRAVAEQVPIVFEKFSQPIGAWVEINAYPSPDGLAVYFRDITHRKQAELALQESEERFRQLTENIGTVFFMSEGFSETSPGQIAYVSAAYERIWGRSCESLYQNTRAWFEAVHPDDRERIEQALPGIPRAEFDVEFRIVRPDGQIRWVHDRVFPIYNERGEIYRTAGIVEDITERKQIEEALQQREAQLRSIADTVPVLISFVDSEQRYRFNNQTYEKWFGHPVAEVYGKHIRDVLGEPAYEIVLPYVEQVLAGQEITFESEILYQEGRIRYISATYVPQFDRQGNVEGYVGLVSDISDRKLAEIALQKSEEQLRLAQQAAGAGLWNWDIVADRVTWSDEYYQLYGIDPATTPSYENWIASIWEPDRERVEQATRAALERRTNLNVEFRIFHPIQGLRWLVAIGQTFYDANGKPIRMTGIALNVTDRKLAEAERQQTLQTLTTLINASPLAIVVIEPNINMTVRLWNPAAEQLFGWTEAEVLGQPIPIVPEEKRDECSQVRDAVAKGEVFTGIETYRCKRDGATAIVSISAAPLYNEQGNFDAILLIFQDITEQQRAEEALRRSEERLRLALLVGKAGIWDWDIPHNRVTWSEQIYQFHGLTPGTFGGRVEDFAQLIHPDDRMRMSEAVRQTLENKAPYELEFRAVQPSGAVRWLSTSGGVIFDDRGHPVRMLGATRDVTERKAVEQERERLLLSEQQAREEAERANRLKDEFLAVLSHELRSPLNPILGWAKLLQLRTLDEQKTKHALATIERNAKLQAQLIEDLLDVSRILCGKLVLRAAPVNLVSTIEAALETVRLAAEAKAIRIQQVLCPNVGQVMGESARLQQVIWNLLSNAVKFTPSGGTIEIRLEQINTYAQLQVKDTGKGITREFLPHVFEYFRQEDGTTTRKFGGLGLGLAIVRHLVELHGGTVWAESPGEGLGATFIVSLPLMPVSTQTPQDKPPATPVAHLTGLRILVVDDQPDIQDIVAFILEQAGATVRVAASALEALHLIEQSLPDVLICDIGMPDMDGYMLMGQIRKLPPEQGGKIPAIALSAYAGEADQKQALAAGFQQHIAKPVEPDKLVTAIVRLKKPA